jgi:hypothetical protein
MPGRETLVPGRNDPGMQFNMLLSIASVLLIYSISSF